MTEIFLARPQYIGYPINNCKTQSLGGSFTMHDPNLWVSLIWSTQNSAGLGTLKYCPPTMVCCLKFEILVTIGNPCKVAYPIGYWVNCKTQDKKS